MNVGYSLLQNKSLSDGERSDLDSLGRMMIRLMEIETSLRSPQAQDLEKPELWKPSIRQFLGKTFNSTLRDLLAV